MELSSNSCPSDLCPFCNYENSAAYITLVMHMRAKHPDEYEARVRPLQQAVTRISRATARLISEGFEMGAVNTPVDSELLSVLPSE